MGKDQNAETLEGRVVVVTGASSGIGRATVLRFADAGATVLAVARHAGALDELAADADPRGGEIIPCPADVSDASALEAVATEAGERFGRLDVWVNNAGVDLFGALEEIPVDMWHRVIEVNLLGTYHGTRAALPWMRDRGRGTIVNVSSVLGHVPAPFKSAYVASKHAIVALSDCTRQEVRDVPGIHVCTVLPGPIDTPLFQHAGNVSGRRIKPVSPVIDAWRVADSILGCIDRPRREVPVGLSTRFNLLVERLAPASVERAAGRFAGSGHFQPAPSGASPGNLWEPGPHDGRITGGWDRRGRQVGGDSDAAVSANGHRAPRPPGERIRRTSLGGRDLVSRVWEQRGAADPGAPSTEIVLVHGLGVASRMCRPVAEELAQHRRVHAVDLPGFGLSDPLDDSPGIVDLSDSLAMWLRATFHTPVILLGVSLGTQVVAEAAARHPDLCAGLVLVSPIVDEDRRTWPRQLLRWQAEQATQSMRLRRIMLSDYRRCGLGRIRQTFSRALHHPTEDAVALVTAPVLVCRGSRDPLVSNGWASALADVAPDGRMVELEGAVHAMTHENPADLAREVELFLGTSTARDGAAAVGAATDDADRPVTQGAR